MRYLPYVILLQSLAVDNDLPRITVPHKMMRKIERRKLAILKGEHQSKKKGPLVISCKKPQLNHHLGQTYSNFKSHMLASAGWKKRQSKGDYFVINAFRSVSIVYCMYFSQTVCFSCTSGVMCML